MDFEGISLRRKFLTGLEPEYINMMIGKHLKANERVLTKSDNSLLLFDTRSVRLYWFSNV